jgi:hypothetical protein
MPAFSHCFLKRLRATSKGSLGFTLTPGIHFPPLPLSDKSLR